MVKDHFEALCKMTPSKKFHLRITHSQYFFLLQNIFLATLMITLIYGSILLHKLCCWLSRRTSTNTKKNFYEKYRGSHQMDKMREVLDRELLYMNLGLMFQTFLLPTIGRHGHGVNGGYFVFPIFTAFTLLAKNLPKKKLSPFLT